MNFAPFTGHVATGNSIPTIQHFAAKFGYEGTSNTVVQRGLQKDICLRQKEKESRYQGTGGGGVQFAVAPASVETQAVKFRQAESVVVVSSAPPGSVTLTSLPLHSVNTGVKYQTISASSTASVNLGNISYGGQLCLQDQHGLKIEHRLDKREYRDDHDFIQSMMQQQVGQGAPLQQGTQQLLLVLHEPKEAAALARAIKQEGLNDRGATALPAEYISIGEVSDTDYLSALPLPLHHLLKYSGPSDHKRDDHPTIVTVAANSLPHIQTITAMPTNAVGGVVVQTASIMAQPATNVHTSTVAQAKKKKKKKLPKEKKPRPKPGEIRLTTALDGSTLYCCPECHMAYPERGLLEQHLLGHTMERRFICDICNAALKRKDHLTRHKQSHNPDRPHVCSVCLKAFKRKEQLTLHFVIHSGEKRHTCNECGKGFYRKDHLRKHTRSHIARRVKAELSQQATAGTAGDGGGALAAPVPAPAPAHS